MKHLTLLSNRPTLACIGDPEHPSLWDSITGFISDPLGVIQQHLIKDKQE